MAYEATAELYRRERDLATGKAQSDYDAYMTQLARQYGAARQNMNANYEARGILRSGEANVGRVRSAEEEAAAGQQARANLDYARNAADVNYLRQLASLQATGSSGGTAGTTTPAAPSAPSAPAAQPFTPTLNRTNVAVTPAPAGTVNPTQLREGGINILPPGINFAALAAKPKPKPQLTYGRMGMAGRR